MLRVNKKSNIQKKYFFSLLNHKRWRNWSKKENFPTKTHKLDYTVL